MTVDLGPYGRGHAGRRRLVQGVFQAHAFFQIFHQILPSPVTGGTEHAALFSMVRDGVSSEIAARNMRGEGDRFRFGTPP
jgi:hypothetical protein